MTAPKTCRTCEFCYEIIKPTWSAEYCEKQYAKICSYKTKYVKKIFVNTACEHYQPKRKSVAKKGEKKDDAEQ